MIPWADLGYEEQMALARCGGPAEWSKLMNPHWTVPGFARGISNMIRDEVVRAMAERRGGILLLSMPPGHNKSYIGSVNFPEWFLERWPDKRVAIVAYGHTKAAEWGEQIRNDIKENPEKFTIRLRPDSTAKDRFHTDQGGSVLCTGVGGPLTGFRAHAVVIDDPVKSDEEAQSELIREKHWNWLRTVAITRRWPEAMTLIIMTRWHEDDMVGRMIRLYRESEESGAPLPPMRVVRIPCIAEENDPLGRPVGAPLWPEVGYDAAWAAQTKTLVGSRVWATMYQQRPTPEGGAIFKREHFRYFTVDPAGFYHLYGDGAEPEKIPQAACWKGQAVDTAMKAKEGSDWTVVLTFAVTPKRQLLVLEVARERLDVPDQLPFLKARRSRWNPRICGVEDKGSGTAVIQEARRQGIMLHPLKAEVDKVTRATPASALYEQHAAYHLRDAPWLDDFESELMGFPNATHDDQVDALAYGVTLLSGGVSLLTSGRPAKPKRRVQEGVGSMTRGEFGGMV